MELDFFTRWSVEHRFELCVVFLVVCILIYLAGDNK